MEHKAGKNLGLPLLDCYPELFPQISSGLKWPTAVEAVSISFCHNQHLIIFAMIIFKRLVKNLSVATDDLMEQRPGFRLYEADVTVPVMSSDSSDTSQLM